LPWERHRCSIDFDPDECKTHQSFKDECDVNKIIDMHVRTGIVTHLNRGTPQYGDAPESDIFDAAVAQAEIRSALEQGYEPPEAPEEPIEPDTGSDTQTPETASQEAPEDSLVLNSSGDTTPLPTGWNLRKTTNERAFEHRREGPRETKMARYRSRLKKRKSRKMFSKTAGWTHKKNTPRFVMRGGTRL
jgi:hypothetical protein